MIFQVGAEFYILPMACIQLLFKLDPSNLVKMHNGQEVVEYRKKIYSIFKLEEVFRDHAADLGLAVADRETTAVAIGSSRVILINTGKQTIAVRVDRVLGQIEAILKPLGDGYKKTDGISGAAVLGNGRLALVLDPLGLERVFNGFAGDKLHLGLAG